MLYSLEPRETEQEEDSHSGNPWSRLRLVDNLAQQDGELAAALVDCEADWKAGDEATKALEEIIPPVICSNSQDDGGDFALYLANAITRNLPENKAEKKSEAGEGHEKDKSKATESGE